ncbi:MAG: hypothetical protein GMKNLPBB_00484 [Myxococcota bacterium]|nr:hypothetical protein [Myxococcota bacterium]
MEGWEPVRGKILEDVAWARALRRRGFATMIADGRLVMRTRMYKSLREIIEGWTKNMFQLLGESVPRSLMTVALVSTLPWIPLAALVFGILAWLGGGSAAWLLYALAQYGLVLYFTARLRAIGPGYPAYAPLAPIANLVTAWIVLRSTWRHVRKTGVSWKGRTYVEEP